ncbi:MAG: M1 family metallopeptidase [Candidatus Kapaibacterium sp.]
MKFILLFVLLISSLSSSAQDIFVPKEIDNAYEKQTRSISGSPGVDYWQNSADYDIDVKINSYSPTLTATARIIYYNNSPFSLDKIVFRTYQDFSKPGKSRDWEVNEKSLSSGMEISKLNINSIDIDLKSKSVSRGGTNLVVKFDTPLNPKSSCDITIVWSFKIPVDFPRMGKYDSTSYMIGHWYPQVSVFDDIDGWDMIDYRGQVEYYNDFNNFKVKITTDRPNMCVWATGVLQNSADILNENYLKMYNVALKGQDFFEVDCSELDADNQLTKNNGNNVWYFKAENVPDFAFAMSDHYKWKMKNVNSGRVNLHAAFRPNALAYNKYDVFSIAEKFIEFMGKTYPGVQYPYPSMTVFNGEGGMEFPMIINDDDTETWESTVYLTSHEMSHTFFPFYMGINERKYAWMDEGWAVFLPQEFQSAMNINAPADSNRDTNRIDSRAYNVRAYLRTAGTFYDIPMLSISNQIRSPSYRLNAYNKAALVYDILKDMIGEEVFKGFLKEYIKIWNGKHPTPYDFFNLFNTYSKNNYNWFWKKWFMEFGTTDLGITEVNQNDDNTLNFVVTNKGGLPVPAEISITDKNGKNIVIKKSATIWANTKSISISEKLTGKVSVIILGSKYIPDLNLKDNEYSSK